MLEARPRELAERKADLMRRILVLTEEIAVALAGENPVEIMGLILRRQALMNQVDRVDEKLSGFAAEGVHLTDLAEQTAELARRSHGLEAANLQAAEQVRDGLKQQIASVERGKRSAAAYQAVESTGVSFMLDERK
jgi:hypothetical protein